MYKFIKIPDGKNEFDISKIEMTIDDSAVYLPDILTEFEGFLRSCQFTIPYTWHLQLVEDEPIGVEGK